MISNHKFQYREMYLVCSCNWTTYQDSIKNVKEINKGSKGKDFYLPYILNTKFLKIITNLDNIYWYNDRVQ